MQEVLRIANEILKCELQNEVPLANFKTGN